MCILKLYGIVCASKSMNFSLLLLRIETSLTEASSVMGLMNLNTTRGLISNCRRREEEEEEENEKKTTSAAAKHYRDLFADLEKRGIYFCE